MPSIPYYNSIVGTQVQVSGENVGIGTSTPAYKLDVAGTGNINTLKINDQYIFPTGIGSVGDSLVYAGSNQVAWSGVSGGGGTDTNDYVDSISFNTSSGVLTLGRTGALSDLTVDLDGRYLEAHPSTSPASSSDNSGRTYIQDILLDNYGHVTGIATATETVTDTNTFVTGVEYNTSERNIILSRNDGVSLTGSLDIVLHSGDNISLLNNDAGYLTSLSGTTVVGSSGYFDVISFNVDDESILTKAQISWDDTEGVLDVGLTDTVTMHVGQHRFYRIRNKTGSTLYKGQVVYATGVHSNGIITPNLYIADNSIDEIRFIGVILEDVSDNTNGYVIDFGHVEDMDLDGSATNFATGTETWVAGDILYAHPTVAGKLTNVKPKHAISVAIILDVGTGNGHGRMFVRPFTFGDIADIHDINVSDLLDNQFLVYDSGTDYWKPSSGLYYADGNLGIGTATPAYELDVNGTINSTKLEITNTSTDDSLLITTTEDSSTAAPVLTFKRNSSSPADADYLGQLKFKGENDADQEVVYAKVTAKISDVTDTTEDGLLEFALRKAGTNNIGMRLTSTDLKLLNGTEMDMGSQQIHNVLDPTSAQDAATKNYVDSNHISISAASSVDNSNGNVIQDITLDSNGHVTALGSIDLDTRYYTESEIDAFNYVDGNGTASYLSKWSDTDTLTNSVVYDDGTNIGIGTASPQAKFHIQKNVTYAGAGTAYGQYTDVNSEITSNGTNYILGLSIDARKDVNTGVTDTGYIMGADILGVTEGGGDITASYGIRTYAGIHTAGSGTITNAFGVRSRVLNLGTGTITNGYGLYIDDVAATNGYGIYQIGSDDDNYFAGNVGIGMTPSVKLDVAGAINSTLASNNKFVVQTSSVVGKLQAYDATNSVYAGAESNHHFVLRSNNTDRLTLYNTNEGVWNENANDYDFRVEGTGDASLLFTDAGSDRVGIGTALPQYKLDVNGTFSANSVNVNDQFTFPTTDGSGNQAIITDGSGNLSWQSVLLDNDLNASMEAGDGITLVYDSGTSVLTIGLNPTGVFDSLSINNEFTFPTTDGSADQVLVTNGSGVITWQNQSAGNSSATAWGSYNGSTNARGQEYNVSSITDNATAGNHTINLSITMSSTDYCVVANEYHRLNVTFGTSTTVTYRATTSFTLWTGGQNGTTPSAYDSPYVAYAVFGS